MKVLLGKVFSRIDLTKSGRFWCNLPSESGKNTDTLVPVEYTSAFVRGGHGFFAIPYEHSDVLIAEFEAKDNRGISVSKYYFLGSINTIHQDHSIFATNILDKEDHKRFANELFLNNIIDEVYESTASIPQMLMFNSHSGNGLFIRDRGRASDSVGPAWQDINIELKSSTNKYVQLVDSPQLDYIRITNGHPSDEITFTHDESPFFPSVIRSAHELHMRTEGRIDLNSTGSDIELFVADNGKNIELTNHAGGMYKEGFSATASRIPSTVSATTPELQPIWDKTYTEGQIGEETYGCIIIQTDTRNIVINGYAHDSVVRIHAPGDNSKVIVDTNGSVFVKAKRQIKLESADEVFIEAPTVRIESTNTYINGTSSVRIN